MEIQNVPIRTTTLTDINTYKCSGIEYESIHNQHDYGGNFHIDISHVQGYYETHTLNQKGSDPSQEYLTNLRLFPRQTTIQNHLIKET